MSPFTKDAAGTIQVGVLSDTHGYLPQSVIATFESRNLDAIVHAGDVCSEQIIGQLKLIAPLVIVRGNCDWLPALQNLTSVKKQQMGNALLVITHKPENLTAELRRLKRDKLSTPYIVGVHGHTHLPRFEQLDDAVWVLCPGSPVEPRGESGPSIAVLTLSPDSSSQVNPQVEPKVEFLPI